MPHRTMQKTRALHLVFTGLLAVACASEDESSLWQSPEGSQPSDASAEEDVQKNSTFALPYEVSLQSESDQVAYLENIDDVEFASLVENARILEFLRLHLDPERLQSIAQAGRELGRFTEENVRPYLSPREQELLGDFVVADESTQPTDASPRSVDKACGSWYYTGLVRTSCNAILASCSHCEIWRRSCEWHDIFSATQQYRNCRTVRYL